MKRFLLLLCLGAWLAALTGCAGLGEPKTYQWGVPPEEGGLSGYPWSDGPH